MTFMLVCTGLVLLSGLFYLFPGSRQPVIDPDAITRANVDWLRLRQQELMEEGNEGLAEDARLRLIDDDSQLGATAADAGHSSDRFPRWLLLPLVAVCAAGLYYRLGAMPDVLINRQLQSITESSPPEQMKQLLAAIEQRVEQRPENLHYAALLGRFYMGAQDYGRAAMVYGDLAQSAPEDAQALAYAAQAEYLASDRRLSDRAQMFAEQALAIDPHQRTALGLLGMASFESGQYRAAIEYWQRLVAMEPEGSESAQMIAGVIARAREQLGETDPVAQAPATAAADTISALAVGVSVQVSFPPGAEFNGSDTVFALARAANAESRMPVAVQRLQASQLPISIRLDDSKSMAGQKLSEITAVMVVVQVSPNGQPGESGATWLGSAGPLTPSTDSSPVAIELAPNGG